MIFEWLCLRISELLWILNKYYKVCGMSVPLNASPGKKIHQTQSSPHQMKDISIGIGYDDHHEAFHHDQTNVNMNQNFVVKGVTAIKISPKSIGNNNNPFNQDNLLSQSQSSSTKYQFANLSAPFEIQNTALQIGQISRENKKAILRQSGNMKTVYSKETPHSPIKGSVVVSRQHNALHSQQPEVYLHQDQPLLGDTVLSGFGIHQSPLPSKLHNNQHSHRRNSPRANSTLKHSQARSPREHNHHMTGKGNNIKPWVNNVDHDEDLEGYAEQFKKEEAHGSEFMVPPSIGIPTVTVIQQSNNQGQNGATSPRMERSPSKIIESGQQSPSRWYVKKQRAFGIPLQSPKKIGDQSPLNQMANNAGTGIGGPEIPDITSQTFDKTLSIADIRKVPSKAVINIEFQPPESPRRMINSPSKVGDKSPKRKNEIAIINMATPLVNGINALAQNTQNGQQATIIHQAFSPRVLISKKGNAYYRQKLSSQQHQNPNKDLAVVQFEDPRINNQPQTGNSYHSGHPIGHIVKPKVIPSVSQSPNRSQIILQHQQKIELKNQPRRDSGIFGSRIEIPTASALHSETIFSEKGGNQQETPLTMVHEEPPSSALAIPKKTEQYQQADIKSVSNNSHIANHPLQQFPPSLAIFHQFEKHEPRTAKQKKETIKKLSQQFLMNLKAHSTGGSEYFEVKQPPQIIIGQDLLGVGYEDNNDYSSTNKPFMQGSSRIVNKAPDYQQNSNLTNQPKTKNSKTIIEENWQNGNDFNEKSRTETNQSALNRQKEWNILKGNEAWIGLPAQVPDTVENIQSTSRQDTTRMQQYSPKLRQRDKKHKNGKYPKPAVVFIGCDNQQQNSEYQQSTQGYHWLNPQSKLNRSQNCTPMRLRDVLEDTGFREGFKKIKMANKTAKATQRLFSQQEPERTNQLNSSLDDKRPSIVNLSIDPGKEKNLIYMMSTVKEQNEPDKRKNQAFDATLGYQQNPNTTFFHQSSLPADKNVQQVYLQPQIIQAVKKTTESTLRKSNNTTLQPMRQSSESPKGILPALKQIQLPPKLQINNHSPSSNSRIIRMSLPAVVVNQTATFKNMVEKNKDIENSGKKNLSPGSSNDLFMNLVSEEDQRNNAQSVIDSFPLASEKDQIQSSIQQGTPDQQTDFNVNAIQVEENDGPNEQQYLVYEKDGQLDDDLTEEDKKIIANEVMFMTGRCKSQLADATGRYQILGSLRKDPFSISKKRKMQHSLHPRSNSVMASGYSTSKNQQFIEKYQHQLGPLKGNLKVSIQPQLNMTNMNALRAKNSSFINHHNHQDQPQPLYIGITEESDLPRMINSSFLKGQIKPVSLQLNVVQLKQQALTMKASGAKAYQQQNISQRRQTLQSVRIEETSPRDYQEQSPNKVTRIQLIQLGMKPMGVDESTSLGNLQGDDSPIKLDCEPCYQAVASATKIERNEESQNKLSPGGPEQLISKTFSKQKTQEEKTPLNNASGRNPIFKHRRAESQLSFILSNKSLLPQENSVQIPQFLQSLNLNKQPDSYSLNPENLLNRVKRSRFETLQLHQQLIQQKQKMQKQFSQVNMESSQTPLNDCDLNSNSTGQQIGPFDSHQVSSLQSKILSTKQIAPPYISGASNNESFEKKQSHKMVVLGIQKQKSSSTLKKQPSKKASCKIQLNSQVIENKCGIIGQPTSTTELEQIADAEVKAINEEESPQYDYQ